MTSLVIFLYFCTKIFRAMKKQLLLFLLILSVIQVFGQYTLLNEENNSVINDGDIITVSVNNFTTHVILTNTGTFPVKATLEATNIVNTDGSELNFCFGFHGEGDCHMGIVLNQIYNSNEHGTTYLAPGQATAHTDIDFTHIDNATAHPDYPKDYVLKLTVINANDDTVVGETNFTYRYQPQGDISTDFVNNDITIATGYHVLNIISKYHADITIYNLTGQKVKEVHLKPSQNHIYTGNMASGIYLVHVKADDKEFYKKVVLK